MASYSVGKTHSELSNWLIEHWLREGPPVGFVEGFSGVGKTSVARRVVQNSGCNSIIVNMPDAGVDQVDNLFLDLATELSSISIDDLATAVTEGTPFDRALPAVLARRVLIVVDEFQRALDEAGRPHRPIVALLDRLANRPGIPGRVLFLTNRLVERSKWSEAYVIRTLNGLAPEDAEDLLDRLLADAGRSREVAVERRRDVVNWLGGNPRAIHVLVTSLEHSSLDDLIGMNPETWEARDRQVSPELLHRLERELLQRTVELLEPETATLLLRLAVHRKPVKREAIELLLPAGAQFAAVRDALIGRFLMEQHSGWFSLNPVVREIALQRLKDQVAELRQAHARAADHYVRHFRAKEIVDSGKLGGYFVEARYHLVQAQRDADLGDIARRFENHLKTRFQSTSPVPSHLDELSERIATLSALLETPGPKGLEYYLARLYEARHAPGDTHKALRYAQRATGSHAPADAWVLRLRLEAQVHGPETVLRVAREGITKVPMDKSVVDLYRCAGELLAWAGRTDEAITILKEGIVAVPADKSVVDLYRCAGELLARAGKTDEAIILLKQGIATVPADKNVVSLYQSAGELLAQAGKTDEAIILLQEGIATVPADKNVSSLYQSAGELLAWAGRTDEAIILLKKGIATVPADKNVFSLYQSAGELLAWAGRTDEAIILLKKGIATVPADKNVAVLYTLCAYQLARLDRLDEAIALLKDGIRKIPVHNLVVALYVTAGNLLGRAGRLDEEISLLKDGLKHLPAGSRSRYKLLEPIFNILCGQQDIQAIEDLLSQAGVLGIEEPQVAYAAVLRLIVQRDWEAAAQTAQQESTRFPRYRPLLQIAVFCWLCVRNWDAAQQSVQRMRVESKPGDPLEWLKAWLALKSGAPDQARASLRIFLNRPVRDQDVQEHFLVQLWQIVPADLGETDLGYFFPILPASLTGLPHDLVRGEPVPRGPAQPVLPPERPSEVQRPAPASGSPVVGGTALPSWPAWMDDALDPSGSKARVDVGIVIALREEFEELAPQVTMRPWWNSDVQQYYYLFERHPDPALAPWRCVVTFMGTMGPTDAGIVGDRLLAQFKPTTVVSIGIAGSTDGDVLVGDIVVASQTDEYLASSKAIDTPDGRDWDIQFSGNAYRSDPAYVAHADNLKYAYAAQAQHWGVSGKRKLLEWIGSISMEELVRQRLIGHVPTIHTGHIASGPIVGAAEPFVNWLKQRRDRKFLALEMESAGILNAAHKRAVSSLIIRGISDYTDARKASLDAIGRGALRRYAMNNALALLWLLMDLRLLKNTP